MQLIPMVHHPTTDFYSPHDLLPAPVPAESDYYTRYFYENVAKHLIRDTVRIMNNGLHLDLSRVADLESTLDDQLTAVDATLASNPVIAEFQLLQHKQLVADYIEERKSKLKSVDHFVKSFKYKDKVHRSYFMYLYAQQQGISQPTTLLEGTSIPQCDAKLVKQLSSTRPLLQRLLAGELTEANPIVKQAMLLLATHKQELHNRKYLDQIANPDLPIPAFNPGSATQKKALMSWLGYESESTSKKTGEDSWSRKEFERILKQETEDDLKQIWQAFIDHSFAAIVRNNFIAAFYKYSVDNRLYGQYKLLGAKSGRYTSSNP